MADNFDKNVVIEIDGNKYGLLLSTKAMEEITEKYGGIETFWESVSGNRDFAEILKQTAWIIAVLANQAILLHNLKNPNDKKELITDEYVKLATQPYEIAGLKNAVSEAIIKGFGRTVESDDSGGGDGENEKNAQGG